MSDDNEIDNGDRAPEAFEQPGTHRPEKGVDDPGLSSTIPAGTELWWKNKFLDYSTHTGATGSFLYTTPSPPCTSHKRGIALGLG